MTSLPVTGAFSVTATYGQKGAYWKNGHQGIDFVAEDRRIFATCTGTVRVVAFDSGGWGQYVSIGDSSGRRHILCHMVKGSVRVKAGDAVTPLTVIGTMGATGNVTGVHVHYQLEDSAGNVLDPAAYLGIPNQIGSYQSADFEAAAEPRFSDYAKIPGWAREAVDRVADQGLMRGDGGKFRPGDPVTRAELAVVLERALTLFSK